MIEFLHTLSMKPTSTLSRCKGVCPIQKMACILSDAWTILILRDLSSGKKRFCELEKSLAGISTRTLTIKLKRLTEEEIIDHRDYDYSLTKKGALLKPLIKNLEKIGKEI